MIEAGNSIRLTITKLRQLVREPVRAVCIRACWIRHIEWRTGSKEDYASGFLSTKVLLTDIVVSGVTICIFAFVSGITLAMFY